MYYVADSKQQQQQRRKRDRDEMQTGVDTVKGSSNPKIPQKKANVYIDD